MSHAITLKYRGAAVESGRMDAYETAGNIVAFSDFLGVLAKAAYGPQVRLKTEVRAFEHGSFAVQFALDLGGILATLLSGVGTPKDLYELASHSFQAWKHLQGSDPKTVTKVSDTHVQIENNHGQVITVRAETVNVLMSPEAVVATSRFVSKALESNLDSVALEQDGQSLADATQDDAPYFTHLVSGELLTENVVTSYLSIESAVFKEGNKWKFSDGQTGFYAAIEDSAFLARVESGEERFGKGDALVVEMKITQSRAGNTVKVDRVVQRVVEHRTPPAQIRLI